MTPPYNFLLKTSLFLKQKEQTFVCENCQTIKSVKQRYSVQINFTSPKKQKGYIKAGLLCTKCFKKLCKELK